MDTPHYCCEGRVAWQPTLCDEKKERLKKERRRRRGRERKGKERKGKESKEKKRKNGEAGEKDDEAQ